MDKSLSPYVEILDRKAIFKQKGRFSAWPSIAKDKKGKLFVVFSGDRDTHVCPFGKTYLLSSESQGHSWSKPQIINNTLFDDRDPGIYSTKEGRLILHWFTSSVFSSWEEKCREAYGNKLVDNWQEKLDLVKKEEHAKEIGNFIRFSDDGGKTWSKRISNHCNTPHGPTQLKDGTLLHVGPSRIDGILKIACETSSNLGESWTLRSIFNCSLKRHKQLCEPHLIETDSGKILVLFRFLDEKKENRFLYQTESNDKGHSWSGIKKTKLWGYPPHLCSLGDKKILVAYGVRKEPYRISGALSYDEGKTWENSKEFNLTKKISNSDLGYPATVLLDDKSLYTVHYEAENKKNSTIYGTHWKIVL
jgi:sialidase-1